MKNDFYGSKKTFLLMKIAPNQAKLIASCHNHPSLSKKKGRRESGLGGVYRFGIHLLIDSYHDDFFDEGLVTAEPGALHRADVGPQPSHKEELGPLAHFVAAL
jgi:hypothetical protein